MKNYIVFYYHGYYPTGGMGDYIGHAETIDELIEFFNSVEESIKSALESGIAYLQVADMVNMKYRQFDEIPTREELENLEDYFEIKHY